MPWIAPPLPACSAERFALILLGLRQALSCRGLTDRALSPLILFMWRRLVGVSDRFTRLMTAFREGRLRPLRARARRSEAGCHPTTDPEANGASDAAAEKKPRKQTLRPSGARGWMIQWGAQRAATCASQLQFWLQDPEVQALIAAEPRRAGRLLRPLCWALDIALPPELALPPRPRRKRTKPAEPPGASGQRAVRRKRPTQAEIEECLPGRRLTAWGTTGLSGSDLPKLIRPRFKLA